MQDTISNQTATASISLRMEKNHISFLHSRTRLSNVRDLSKYGKITNYKFLIYNFSWQIRDLNQILNDGNKLESPSLVIKDAIELAPVEVKIDS